MYICILVIKTGLEVYVSMYSKYIHVHVCMYVHVRTLYVCTYMYRYVSVSLGTKRRLSVFLLEYLCVNIEITVHVHMIDLRSTVFYMARPEQFELLSLPVVPNWF